MWLSNRSAVHPVDTRTVPGLGWFGFEGEVLNLIFAEIVLVAMFVLVYGYDRWKAIRRLRSYRQGASAT